MTPREERTYALPEFAASVTEDLNAHAPELRTSAPDNGSVMRDLKSAVLDSFYTLKPLIPRSLQIRLRQYAGKRLVRANHGSWPISEAAGATPPAFPGWPGGKRFAFGLAHDVESAMGVCRCEQLADLEEERGFRSAFGFVPRRYRTPEDLRRTLAARGFEIMVHDLYHDGKLFRTRRLFENRRDPINAFLRAWETTGFSSGSMHHNLSWITELDIDYSTSTYDVDPFEPQRCGAGRIFPYWVQSPNGNGRGFIEIPYTLPQDFTLFVTLGEKDNDTWRRKLDWIAAKGGMVMLKTHPDYMLFPNERSRMDGYPVKLYTDLLDYTIARFGDEAWFAQPSEIARYWGGLQFAAEENSISPAETFCTCCRQAHKEGLLCQSRPRSQRQNGVLGLSGRRA